MPWLVLRLLGLRSAIGRAWGWATANTGRMLAIALCVSLAGNYWQHRTIAKRDATIAANAAAYQAASAVNLAAQKAQVIATEAKSASIAKDTEHATETIRTVYVDRSNANADRMRLDKVCRSATNPPGQDNPAPVDNGPGAEAIVVERRDYDILVENTARLEAVHGWGDRMIDGGLAKVGEREVPEVGFGQGE